MQGDNYSAQSEYAEDASLTEQYEDDGSAGEVI